ncbi:SDR family oxidoreductase [Granulosicoccaceae sp. 1_MG-2023]|nr:SDR family oxidoreductase [Granulosicoccaceae sp. 1_MG-2023]
MNIIIVGATSAMAQHTARRYAKAGNRFVLIARNAQKLTAVADDLRARGAECETLTLDINDLDAHAGCVSASIAAAAPDLLLMAHGTLPDQQACEQDTALMMQEFATNGSSSLALLNEYARVFEAKGSGSIVVITSVAGDRGRQSNYVYGAAKAAVSTYLSGLRNRLSKCGVSVIDIRPGFVDTPMTADFSKGALWAKPEQIAAGIEKAVAKKRNIVYLPGFWWAIMLIIRNIPEVIFKRLSL